MILVTGGTGFFGRHLVRRLAAAGKPLRVLSRSAPSGASLPGIDWARGDIRDPACLAPALEGVHSVIHAAAVLGEAVADPDSFGLNVEGTASIARAARAAGVRRFLHVSSAGVYGDGKGPAPHRESDPPNPGTAYERSKLAAERALVEALDGSATAWTILRPTGLYGSDRPATAALFAEVARRRLWVHGATRVVIHPTHVLDLVDAAERALGRDDLGSEVLNVGGDRALEYSELIALIGRRVGHTPLQLRLPAWRENCRAVDIGKARRVLGYAPMPLERGLDEASSAVRQ